MRLFSSWKFHRDVTIFLEPSSIGGPRPPLPRSKMSLHSSSAASMSQNAQSKFEDCSYESAISALNSLQTNSQLLQKIRKERQKHVHLNLPLTTQYLQRSGMTLDDLDTIKVIHVSGTKGKGSTCAFTESILRQYGLRTGFYSSPHLVSVTERVRLDGQPISKEKFAEYFWDVYNKVCRGRVREDRPPYFQFLTILAFNIFWREKVEVAIIEVGIGGEYDCTNIIRKPVVSGITALGLDHTNILGNTISDIAWHKAGIMKPGVGTYIDGNQQEQALQTISERSIELGAEFCAKVPPLQNYYWGRYPLRLGLYGQVQQQNASLALALSRHFLAAQGAGVASPPAFSQDSHDTFRFLKPFSITVESAVGLRLTDWPGRTQLIDHGRILYLLDGAHTEESIKACRSWFSLASKVAIKKPTDKIFKVMLFNTSGDRDPRVLLQPFINSDLDLVIFCTNISGINGSKDQQNQQTTEKLQLERCENHLHVWTKLQTSEAPALRLLDRESTKAPPPSVCVPGLIIPSISEALHWITQGTDPSLVQSYQTISDHSLPQDLEIADQVQVLITGSLHLVGGALACIQPDGLPVRHVDPELIRSYRKIKNSNGHNSVPGMM